MIIGGKRRSVVVKVRHPGVETRIRQDFEILKPLASAASKVTSLTGYLQSCTLNIDRGIRTEAAQTVLTR